MQNEIREKNGNMKVVELEKEKDEEEERGGKER